MAVDPRSLQEGRRGTNLLIESDCMLQQQLTDPSQPVAPKVEVLALLGGTLHMYVGSETTET